MTFMLTPTVSFTPDKFGFYTVDDRKTFSKFEAKEWAKPLGKTVQWNFNNHVFDNLDWTHEPEVDLWELYKLRAKQIRDSYDYVVLWYSGGSDSHNMLMAWMDAGCKIDEIATTWNYAATNDKQSFYNAEITNVVLPDIKKLKDRGLDFKFRLVDISQICLDTFNILDKDFEYNVNFFFSVNNVSRTILRDKIDDYKNMIAAGKRVCFVWGKEKPIIQMQNGKYYFSFSDCFDDNINPRVQQHYYDGWYDELFYWTPDMPLIPLKQAHIVKKFLHMCNDPIFYEPINKIKTQINGINVTLNMHLTDSTIKRLLYPKWSNNIFCNGKSPCRTFATRDTWFFTSNLEQHLRFVDITKSYFNVVDPIPGYSTPKIPAMYSPKYWLE